MNSEQKLMMRRRTAGQTIIVAMIIMGLLLILGFVFIGIINRNIATVGRLQRRSVAADLSEAGVRYAHMQLLQSQLGADWRPLATALSTYAIGADPGGEYTDDPDALFLRQPARLKSNGAVIDYRPGQPDQGGPDGLGPFTRLNYNNGRDLIRVRYAPSDINIFFSQPNGPLRSPGLLRNYIIIESVGRAGPVLPQDPSTLSGKQNKVQQFNTAAELQDVLAKMRGQERSVVDRSFTRAFVSIGIIETARYVTNKYNVTRPVELGVSDMLGAIYNGIDVATGGGGSVAPLNQQLGTSLPLYTISNTPALTPNSFPGFGSMYINGDVLFHGNVTLWLNKTLGDRLIANGVFRPANTNSKLNLLVTQANAGAWTTTSTQLSGNALDSRSGAFSTVQGTIEDGIATLDNQGFPRGAGTKVPPSIETRNADSGENRYVLLTRESGALVNGSNIGSYGYGQGIYINNFADRQAPESESGRQAVGSEVSQVYDWLNPNNGQAGSGWRGFYYVPPGAYVQLIPDGFLVIRGATGPAEERTWRNYNGSDTGSSLIRYRIGFGTDGRLHVVNTFTPTVSINANLGNVDFDKGPVFNGVLYFEGNVRIRGTIPTDVQLSVVSNGTIYVEGSITKCQLGNGLQIGITPGQRLPRLSHSMLMLMAKDYVTVNTTQFLGPTATQALEPVSDVPNTPGYTPLRTRTGEQLTLQAEFALNNELDPNMGSINPSNPQTWPPYPATYYQFNLPGSRLTTTMVLAHTMDDGPGQAAFSSMNVNFGAFDTASPPESTYYFPVTSNNLISSVYAGTPPVPATYPIYGLGGEPFQRYGKFESALFPLVDPNTVNVSDARMMIANNANGTYRLFSEGLNDFLIRPTNYNGIPTNDYLIGKTALMPHDVRIEASMFAEEGSFFVIPGQWFNPNPNDRRDTYNGLGTTKAERDQRRLEDFGSFPGMPFYGEAPDIRITVIGSVSENMPPSIDVQSEWMRKWGWIPREIGASGLLIPDQHVPRDPTYRGVSSNWQWVPNLIFAYDPVLATARRAGFNNDPNQNPLIRTDAYGRALPPLPRLPVSPSLAYFGEVR